jgi:hypothetical protein
MEPTTRQTAAERQLAAKLRPDEQLVAWGRAWVSRDGRGHSLFAARTLDFVVRTDDRLYLFSTGFFTRRPRRCVYGTDLGRLRVETRQGKTGRRLRLQLPEGRALLLDMRSSARNNALADALVTTQ